MAEEGVWQRRKVGLAELVLGKSPEVLVAYGLGSCVGVALFDPERRVGGLAHIMLPAFGEGPGDDNPLKYADRAVPELARALVAAGASTPALVARVAGGSCMFREIPRASVGERNVQAALAALADLEISVVARDTGGDHGRTLELHTESGGLFVRSYRKGTRWI